MEPWSCFLSPGLQDRWLGLATTSDLMVKMGISSVRTFCSFGQQKSSFMVFIWVISVTLPSMYKRLVLLNKSHVSGSMLLPGKDSWVICKTLSSMYWETHARVAQLHLWYLLNNTFCVVGCVEVYICIYFQKDASSSSVWSGEHTPLQTKLNWTLCGVALGNKLCSIQCSN